MRLLGRIRTVYTALAFLCLNALIALVVLNGVAWWLQPPPPGPTGNEPWPGLARNIQRFAYPELSHDDAMRLASETLVRFQYEPFTEIRERPLEGRFIHVDESGFRRIEAQGPWPPAKDAYNVFVFGGSTTFGYGVMDRDTIPSFLQSLLPAIDGRPVRVYNFGRCGYYSSQERILFERLVTAGHVPHAAIFVDGLNDFSRPDDEPFVASWMENAFAEGSTPLAKVLDVFPLATTVRHAIRLVGGDRTDAMPAARKPIAAGYADPARADRVIERWIRSMWLIEGMGRMWGIATVFVWQPVASYEFPAGDGRPLHKAGANGWAGFAYPRMRARVTAAPLGPHFLWCADVARDGSEGFYLDAVHYAPVLAKRVAECIANGIRDRDVLRAPVATEMAAAPATMTQQGVGSAAVP